MNGAPGGVGGFDVWATRQRNNLLGAERLLQAALRRLEQSPPYFGGMNVVSVCDEIRERIEMLRSGEAVGELSPVRIRAGCL